jgi:hypothetical protein
MAISFCRSSIRTTSTTSRYRESRRAQVEIKVTKKNPSIAKIKDLLKTRLVAVLKQKILEFNTEFQQMGTAPPVPLPIPAEGKTPEASPSAAAAVAPKAPVSVAPKEAPEHKEQQEPKAQKDEREETKAKPGVEASAWNAKGYHWEEKAVSGWASARFKELLLAITFDLENGTCKVAEITSFNGDVSRHDPSSLGLC